ncbi:MAG TPA: hypothetical protein VFQ53_13440 [Kofleriaceae bacterium]|nr:hypothetical protein [Kofleriaceae bacterium]
MKLVLSSILVLGACVAQTATPMQPASGPGYAAASLTINGAVPSPAERQTLAQLEAQYGITLPAGAYWYDATSGAFGRWGGPTEAVITAGLDLGPPTPYEASGAGTQIVINGRAIHPAEQAYLEYLVGGAIPPGRYALDAQGNAGPEGGPATINLAAMAAQRNGGGARGTTTVYGGTDHTGRASWFESDGKCRYIETPSGGFSSGC